MECFEMPLWNRFTREELEKIVIHVPNEEVRKRVKGNWDSVAKPLDGMGRFETLTAQIGSILGTDKIDVAKKAVLIMCADNGIVEEGISQSNQEVTALVAEMMVKKQSSVCKMAASVGADTIPIDIGINKKERIAGMVQKKIRCGTRNFLKEPAMTEAETVRAIAVGIEMAGYCKKEGYQLLALGELGIGNTTTSSAVGASLLKCSVAEVTGRGAGLSDAGLLHKQQVISAAIEKYDLYQKDAFTVLQTVGGLDIAGLTGICIGGAMFQIPIVLDGVITMVAALLAERLVLGTKAYLLPSHKGKEPAIEVIAKELGMELIIDGKLALGEGTGAVMMFPLLDMALSIYQERTTFHDIQLEQYERLS